MVTNRVMSGFLYNNINTAHLVHHALIYNTTLIRNNMFNYKDLSNKN